MGYKEEKNKETDADICRWPKSELKKIGFHVTCAAQTVMKKQNPSHT